MAEINALSENKANRDPIQLVVGKTPTDTGKISQRWIDFVRFCEKLGHGDISSLKIQDGQPVIAEMVRVKVKFG